MTTPKLLVGDRVYIVSQNLSGTVVKFISRKVVVDCGEGNGQFTAEFDDLIWEKIQNV